MGAVTDRELQEIRDAQEEYLPDVSVIRRKDFLGGDSDYDKPILAVGVPTRFTPGFGQWRLVADRFQGVDAFVVTVPWDQDLRPGDEIVDSGARTYQVRAVKAPSSYQTAKQALCDKVTD